MKVLFASAECAPFFKTGGLGDVAGSLPKELVKQGVELAVVLPYFTKIPETYQRELKDVCQFQVAVGWRKQYCGIKQLEKDGVTYYFIDNRYYFDRDNLYGYYDDGERFAFFQLALIEMMEKIEFIPDVIHSNDYHTAMIPFLLKEKYSWIRAYREIKTVVTIHNIEFQGHYSADVLGDLFGMGMERYHDGAVGFDNGINFLKAGIVYADRITTVSPSYAKEIQTPEFGCRLDGILRMEANKLSGILNGIDYTLNNPETDESIPYTYSKEDRSGKQKDKLALQKMMHLPESKDTLLIGVVGRLTRQKGFDLLVEEAENLLQQDVQLVILGTGDPAFEHDFAYFANKYPEKCAVNILFDVSLAQKIYAGSDLFLMPSAFEPCGLSQMISMRYGTIPLVHEVGGLRDTVLPYNVIDKTGDGFGFQTFTGFYLMETIKQAIELYQKHPNEWENLITRAMSKDFSWSTSSKTYVELYNSLK
ncbi:MAG: glycogen synthase GlgA [Enterococcus sp.]